MENTWSGLKHRGDREGISFIELMVSSSKCGRVHMLLLPNLVVDESYF